MKTKSLIIVLVCLVLQTKAQTTDTNTIVREQRAWSTLFSVPVLNIKWTYYTYFNGDSTVGEQVYKKVFSYEGHSQEAIKYEGLMREQDKKTYFIPVDSITEYILYDFSLEEGMHFEYIDFFFLHTISCSVERVDSVEIGGIQKKRIQLAVLYPYRYSHLKPVWIENLGSLEGILFPAGTLVPGPSNTLLCYFENNDLIYKNPDYLECYYDEPVSVQPISNERDITVYPNPVKNLLTVSSSGNSILQIEIYDILGRKRYCQPWWNVIDMSFFSRGLYILKVYDTKGQVSLFKLIKQ